MADDMQWGSQLEPHHHPRDEDKTMLYSAGVEAGLPHLRLLTRDEEIGSLSFW
jgi:hypothetical protein